jgi:NADH:ubiquinone oxidoreductase subunit 6 (subunit J)
MSRLEDRQPFVRVAVLCGALGLLFLFVAARMLLDGARVVDEIWALALGVALVAIAAAAVVRGRRAMQFEAMRARATARAKSRDDGSRAS